MQLEIKQTQLQNLHESYLQPTNIFSTISAYVFKNYSIKQFYGQRMVEDPTAHEASN